MPTKKGQARQPCAAEILRRLKVLYPDAACELDHQNPYQLLVATVLSAQTTDRAVNQVTPALFARFRGPASLAAESPADVEPFIATIGLFRNKARAVVGAARAIVEDHGGVVPRDRASLEALPGVGRTTAHVVLATAFGEPALAADTHVQRLAGRLGLEVWFSASLRGDEPLFDERGIPFLLKDHLGAIDVLLSLQHHGDHVHFTLVKDHDRLAPKDLRLKLDPKTLLIARDSARSV